MTDDQIEQVRAARTYLDARHPVDSDDRDQVALDAFMAIFHPERKRIVLPRRRRDG